ncbi:MAG: hypothetical protein QXL57_02410 [Candidatus Bathyarchaeia archaeon]
MEKESGIRRTVWLPKELDAKVEEARKLLGLGRSGFYRFAIIETIKNLLTAKNQTQTQAS